MFGTNYTAVRRYPLVCARLCDAAPTVAPRLVVTPMPLADVGQGRLVVWYTPGTRVSVGSPLKRVYFRDG
jgi:hypothetical protein